MLAELADVLARNKFHVKSSQVNRFLANIENNSKVVEDDPRFKVTSEASDHDFFINAAYT